MAIGIYKITNNINGKVYIGQSRNITVRWEAHKSKARSLKATKGNNMYITNAMRKYGIENFTKEVIEVCSIKELDTKESYWIQYYDSTNREKGYNQTTDKQHPVHGKLTQEQVNQIYDLLANSKLTLKQIGEQFSTSEDSISYINTGKRWINENISYPIRTFKAPNRHSRIHDIDEQEFREVLMKSFAKGAAEYYNVNIMTIRKWCDHFGLPKTISELKALR